MIKTMKSAAFGIARKLRDDNSGLALAEFGYSLPLLLGLTGYGLEMANLANANMRVSQAANSLADNVSRVGLESALAKTQLRESDINDGLVGVARQSGTMDIGTRGRVIVSSLERNTSGGQWIRWQRCLGTRNYNSSFGNAGDGATGTSFPGMGPATARVTSPDAESAVIFVEIIYDYKSIFSTIFVNNRQIKFHASYIVRDKRDLAISDRAGITGITNPGNVATAYTCDRRTAT
jgi:Flp pilus assembly protein TadG